MTSAEIHARAHRMQFAELRIINQFARVNKDTTDNRRFNVRILAADRTMNAQQRTLVSIDNVFQHAQPMEAHAVNEPNATELIITPYANVVQALLVIRKLDAMLSVAEVTQNVQMTKLASTTNAKAHVNRCRFANEPKFVEFTITNRSVAARQEQFRNQTEHAELMTYCAEVIVIVHHKQHA